MNARSLAETAAFSSSRLLRILVSPGGTFFEPWDPENQCDPKSFNDSIINMFIGELQELQDLQKFPQLPYNVN